MQGKTNIPEVSSAVNRGPSTSKASTIFPSRFPLGADDVPLGDIPLNALCSITWDRALATELATQPVVEPVMTQAMELAIEPVTEPVTEAPNATLNNRPSGFGWRFRSCPAYKGSQKEEEREEGVRRIPETDRGYVRGMAGPEIEVRELQIQDSRP